MSYKEPNQKELYQSFALLKAGLSQSEIPLILGRHSLSANRKIAENPDRRIATYDVKISNLADHMTAIATPGSLLSASTANILVVEITPDGGCRSTAFLVTSSARAALYAEEFLPTHYR